jgi:alanyl-tRNA synthetase
MTTANELRSLYVDYFVSHGHTHVSSSPIVPPDDPTMLFTSAGMVQFKPFWGGQVEPLPYSRATTVQKCLRAGGKGSDLENVGKTLRHHTFFEMLGNFSFGDYFKLEALEWGWDFIWNKMKLPRERLWATYYELDDETPELLEKKIGIPRDRIIPLDKKENFWGPAGDTGACGPCSEVCFFMGTDEELKVALSQDGETIARRIVEEGDLFLEIWNMVFPQYDQQKDGSRPPLKYRGIDTGAGLERMTTALNFIETGGVIRTPYETDLLSPITRAVAASVGKEYRRLSESGPDYNPRDRYAINAIADHVRALTFALSEGIAPSNGGRGYVLRRILRRALRFAYLMDKSEPFMHKLVDVVVDTMGGVYPEIKPNAAHVARIIKIEEESFLRTVAQGSRILDEKIAQAKNSGLNTLPGADAFLLHATYGFPVDMTAEIAEDAGLTLDQAGYASAMQAHQAEARKSWKGAERGEEAELLADIDETSGSTNFLGYETFACEARVLAILSGGKRVDAAAKGEEATVVLDQTPFYAESGGQVGDTGEFEGTGSSSFIVKNTLKTPNSLFLHRGKVAGGTLRVGDALTARVDTDRRMAIMRNHTVTHLLQAALRQVLGGHITQAGSYVGPEGMRFDFSNPEAVKAEDLARVERIVNEFVLADHAVSIEELPLEEARKRGAIAPFGEKYGHVVRVVQIGGFSAGEKPVSIEFCGGTHLRQIGRIGSFRLVSESSVAAGIRRIEGTTGFGAYEQWAATRDVTAGLCRSLAVREGQLAERVEVFQTEIKNLKRDLKKAKSSAGSAAASLDDLLAQATEAGGIKVVCAQIEGADAELLRTLADQLRDKAGQAVVLLGAEADGKALLLCAVTKAETARVKAGDVIKQVAPLVGGGGGGRPDMAQAGGKNPEKLADALAQAPGIIQGLIG